MLDVAALEHVNELAIAEDGNRRRRGTASSEIGTSALGGFGILPGKDGVHAVRLSGVLQRHAHGRPHTAGGASTNGIDNHHRSSLLRGQFAINLGRSLQFLNSQPLQFLAHGNHHDFRIHKPPQIWCGWS